jgi:hypothetical protein
VVALIVVQRFIAVERLFDGGPLLGAQQLWAALTTEVAIVIRTFNIAVGEPTLLVSEFTAAAQS